MKYCIDRTISANISKRERAPVVNRSAGENVTTLLEECSMRVDSAPLNQSASNHLGAIHYRVGWIQHCLMTFTIWRFRENSVICDVYCRYSSARPVAGTNPDSRKRQFTYLSLNPQSGVLIKKMRFIIRITYNMEERDYGIY